MRGTVFEKIIKRHADSNIQVIPDEVISISIDHILIPDNSIMPIFDLLEHSHMHIKHQNVYVALTNYHYQYEPNYGAKQRKIIDAVRKHGFNILENYQGVWNINFLQK